jgi:hypothetical protein
MRSGFCASRAEGKGFEPSSDLTGAGDQVGEQLVLLLVGRHDRVAERQAAVVGQQHQPHAPDVAMRRLREAVAGAADPPPFRCNRRSQRARALPGDAQVCVDDVVAYSGVLGVLASAVSRIFISSRRFVGAVRFGHCSTSARAHSAQDAAVIV